MTMFIRRGNGDSKAHIRKKRIEDTKLIIDLWDAPGCDASKAQDLVGAASAHVALGHRASRKGSSSDGIASVEPV